MSIGLVTECEFYILCLRWRNSSILDFKFFINKQLGGVMQLDYYTYSKGKLIRVVVLSCFIPNKQHGDEGGEKNEPNWRN